VEQGIPTGDYTLQGYEEVFTIERKGHISEFAHNIFEDRFENELERLARFPHAFILFEFTMRDLLNYPVGSGIPRRRWGSLKFKGPFILKRVTEMMRDYPTIHFIFCGDAGKEMASSIFKRITESDSEQPNPDKQEAEQEGTR
jgi:hypothetical protein